MKLELQVPQGVTATVKDNVVTVKGSKGTIDKEFKSKVLTIKQDNNKIILETKNDRKMVLAILNTTKSIIENMFSGVNNKYTYTLRGVYSHFPITLAIKGKNFVITNYLGEKNPRSIGILDNVEVTIKGKDVIVTSVDKEKAGIVAGLIENKAKVLNRDRRIFQDGVYIISKGVQDDK
jgi:large subunit ribosomal protein L6